VGWVAVPEALPARRANRRRRQPRIWRDGKCGGKLGRRRRRRRQLGDRPGGLVPHPRPGRRRGDDAHRRVCGHQHVAGQLLSAHPSVCLSVCLSVCASVRPRVHGDVWPSCRTMAPSPVTREVRDRGAAVQPTHKCLPRRAMTKDAPDLTAGIARARAGVCDLRRPAQLTKTPRTRTVGAGSLGGLGGWGGHEPAQMQHPESSLSTAESEMQHSVEGAHRLLPTDKKPPSPTDKNAPLRPLSVLCVGLSRTELCAAAVRPLPAAAPTADCRADRACGSIRRLGATAAEADRPSLTSTRHSSPPWLGCCWLGVGVAGADGSEGMIA
jgi:hypothetical protein